MSSFSNPTKRQKERLLKLADFLDTVPTNYKKNFNLDRWTAKKGGITDQTIGQKLKNKDCGFTACAVGFCGICFPRSFTYTADGTPRLKSSRSSDEPYNSIEKFFGVTEDGVEYLFYPHTYRRGRRGPKSVAKRIRQFVKSGPPKSYKEYNV